MTMLLPVLLSLAAGDAVYEERVKPFLARHCVECHGPEKAKADLRLDQLPADLSARAGRERWLEVLERIRSGAMPPKAKPRPAESEVKAVSDWIGERSLAARAGEGRVVLRRLNRTEYTNTVNDLLGVEVDLREKLALDGTAEGFDNVGAGLHLSSFALERYLEAADAALSIAIADRPAPKKVQKSGTLKNDHRVRQYGPDHYRIIGDTVVSFIASHEGIIHLGEFYPPDRGYYRFRITASGFQGGGKPVTFQVGNPTTGWTTYFDAPSDTPTVFEFTVRAEARSSVWIRPYGLSKAYYQVPGRAATYDGPGLAIHGYEFEGPLTETWPPATHTQIFGDLPQVAVGKWKERLEVVSKDPLADAERILRPFIRRAFRRPVTEAEVAPFLALARARLEEKDSFEQAVRASLAAVMSAPAFLFLSEKPGRLDDFALASRLSYFLWSTMPDDELLDLAERKKLSDAATLRGQVERMLKSPKARAFSKNFCGQWLGLRDIDFTAPHYALYPEFDEMLKLSMVRESELFFEELLREDLSLLHIVSSDFSMLNGRLARHYGIPGVEGLWEFRKVALPPESHRGGVLTMASVLKVTADGTSTSPVKRGAWVLDRVLGTPPPQPPADVPPLEPDIRGAKTIREQLAKHRDNPACASCHAQIDPPGFALESFDVIGGWREYYRISNWTKGAKAVKGVIYLQGPDVDATGETADGRPFRTIDEFKRLLLRDRDQIARGLAHKLVTYATGGAPEAIDAPEVEVLMARVREKNYGLKTLVHEIVQSRLFREK